MQLSDTMQIAASIALWMGALFAITGRSFFTAIESLDVSVTRLEIARRFLDDKMQVLAISATSLGTALLFWQLMKPFDKAIALAFLF